MTRPLVIVGGGPTGLGASIHAAQQGLSPLVIEPKEGTIDKACGEGLMPGAIEHLHKLGVDPEGRPFKGIRYCDAHSELQATGHFPTPARGVRRLKLHESLRERAQELGVEFLNGKVDGLSQTDDEVILSLRDIDNIQAEHVIAADGLHSTIRRELGIEPSPPPRRRFGVRRHFQIEPWSDFVEVYWSDGAEAYVTPVADDCVGVAILYEPQAGFDTLLIQNFPKLQSRLGSAPQASKDQGAGPFDQRVRSQRKGRVLLAGDAAGYLDPLTGEGVALGLKTAEAAVQAIASGTPHKYEAAYRSTTRRYYWLTRGLLTLTRPRFVHRPLIQTLRAIPPVFNTSLRFLAT